MKQSKFKETEIGKIPEDWNVKEIGDVCHLVRDSFSPSKEDSRAYIGLEHIEQNTLRLISIGSSKNINSNKLVFRKGQILFGKLRPYFRKVYRPNFEGVCSTDIFVIDANKKFDNWFLFYFFADRRMIEEATLSSEGTRMPRASWKYLEKLQRGFPDLSEQKAIAKILSDLDSKIELNQKINKTLESIGQELFKHWFVDFEFPNDEGKPYRSSGGKMVESELGEIPKGWRVNVFSEVVGVNPKRSLPKGVLAKKISMADLIPWQSWVVHYEIVNYDSGPKFISGDTLLARITPSLEHGKTAIVSLLEEREVGFGSTEFIVMAPQEITSCYYIFYLARSREVRDFAIGSMTGTSGRQRVPSDCFDYLKIIVPPEDFIHRYHNIATPIFDKITANSWQSRELESMRDSLLPRLMSGRIRVPIGDTAI